MIVTDTVIVLHYDEHRYIGELLSDGNDMKKNTKLLFEIVLQHKNKALINQSLQRITKQVKNAVVKL